MKAVAVWALKFALSYLHKHPDKVDDVLDRIKQAIPGKVDDAALDLLRKVLGV